MNLPPSVRLAELRPGYPVLYVDHPTASGEIALLGAHVMRWTPAGQKPVLYMSADAVFEEGSPIRGGIPICWPWFGPKPDLPGHGVVRTRFWALKNVEETESGVEFLMAFESDEQTRRAWPHDFRLELAVTMGKTLRVRLHMKHLGSMGADYTGALHTYLTVGAIEQTTVLGLEGTNYLDTLDGGKQKPSQGEITFEEEIDRVYQSSGLVLVKDDAWNRTIEVTKSGSEATVVWNPWIEKSKRLSDLPDEAYHEFLCIEAANAGEDIIHLEPGEEHVLSTAVRLRN